MGKVEDLFNMLFFEEGASLELEGKIGESV